MNDIPINNEFLKILIKLNKQLSIGMYNVGKNCFVITKKNAEWAEAKKKCRLNDETLKMAREIGLNPRSLIKDIPSPSQQWKAPVIIWIREMYQERLEKFTVE